MKVSDWVVKARESRHWSQADLARMLDLDPARVCRYERGVFEPSMETMVKISQVCNYSLPTGHADTMVRWVARCLFN